MKKNILALTVLSTLSFFAYADESHLYAGASLGSASGATTAIGSKVAGGMSYSGFVGNKISPNVSAEGGYTALLNSAQDSSSQDKYSISGIEFSGLYSIPVQDSVSIFGRVGYAWMTVKIDSALVSSFGNLSTAQSATGTIYGFGGQYKLNEETSIRAEYTAYGISAPMVLNGSGMSRMSVSILNEF